MTELKQHIQHMADKDCEHDTHPRLSNHSHKETYKRGIKDAKAIGFAEWCADNGKYSRVINEKGNSIWIDQDTPIAENNGDYYIYTTEELYLIYLKQK